MNKDNLHQELLVLIRQAAGTNTPDHIGFGLKYVGTTKPGYHLDTAGHKQIIKDFLKANHLTPPQFFELVTSLYVNGQSYDEIILAGRLVGVCKFRDQLDLKLLDTWLSHVSGWAETDTLCQMAFTDLDLLTRWPDWKQLLIKFNSDANVHKRRASLVLLTKPVRLSSDVRLADLAFANTEKLKPEKDILITKAVSWILRSLIKHHPQRVGEYLNANQDSLPKIAYREATTKLLTGKKYIRPTNHP